MSKNPNITSAPYMPPGMPLPGPASDGLDAAFWEGTRNHRLLVQRCTACGTFQFGPEWICHHCRSDQLGWHECAGRGRVYAFERVWHPVHPALKDRVPYLIVLVELPDAGSVRLVGNLLDDPCQDVQIGAEVEVAWEDHEEATLPQWRLV
ncbi:MAG: Zn-ribbon domain-containing OB-fold protein [Candidatus Binatia bacterium]